MSLNTRQKGKFLENYVADQIALKGLDPRARAEMSSGAGTREKSDIWTSMMILGQQVGFECKNHKTLHINDWWEQTKKLEKLSYEPILVFKVHQEQLGDTKIVMYLDTLLEMAKKIKELETQLTIRE
jgi:hypothetical protein